ncbi:twin-arginine translocation signal domain-containing protein [Streptomyces sp. NPDC059466]
MPVNPLNRREFVKRSAVTGAAVGARGRAAAPPPPISRWAILGSNQ